MMNRSTVQRLGKAAGENCATGAYQRLEQSVANFEQRNDVDPGDNEIFRRYAVQAFQQKMNSLLTPEMGADEGQGHLDNNGYSVMKAD